MLSQKLDHPLKMTLSLRFNFIELLYYREILVAESSDDMLWHCCIGVQIKPRIKHSTPERNTFFSLGNVNKMAKEMGWMGGLAKLDMTFISMRTVDG